MFKAILDAVKTPVSFTAESDKIVKAIDKAQGELDKIVQAKTAELEELRQTEEDLYNNAKEFIATYEAKKKA